MNHRRFYHEEAAVIVAVVAVIAVVGVAVAVEVEVVEAQTHPPRHVYVKPFGINITESWIRIRRRKRPIHELEMP